MSFSVLVLVALVQASVALAWTTVTDVETLHGEPAWPRQVDTLAPVLGENAAADFAWLHQFGTPEDDQARGIAVDATGVYVAAFWAGGADALIRKYEVDGNEVWSREFGTSESDRADAVAVDVTGVYVAGSTTGKFSGQQSAGGLDVFVRKYDLDGNDVWTIQSGSSRTDASEDIAVGSSGIYVVGSARILYQEEPLVDFDAFVRKYDLGGEEIWVREIVGTSNHWATGVAVDSSGVYVTGYGDALPGQATGGAFVRRYDFDGNEVWTRQFDDSASGGIALDASGIYIAGSAGLLPGQTNAGNDDAFIRKYGFDGNEIWTRQFGSSSLDSAEAIAVDASGVYVTGFTFDALPGQTSAGEVDAFVRQYSLEGDEGWTSQFGTASWDPAFDIDLRPSGVYLAGWTWGALPGQTSSGGKDAFVAKFGAPSADLPPGLEVPGPIIAEASGPSGAKVDFAVTAEDDVDGSLTPVCNPASGSLFPLGTTTVTCTARDSAGNEATATFTVEVRDSRPPVLTVPADIQVEATGPSGAAVTFDVTVTDLVDPSPVVSCSPSSGSTFGIGSTTVTCTATDSAGNTVTAPFSVTVTERGVGPSGFVLSPLAAAAVVVAIGVVAATVAAFMRRKRKGRDPSGGEGGTP